jgi:hypothetical protein
VRFAATATTGEVPKLSICFVALLPCHRRYNALACPSGRQTFFPELLLSLSPSFLPLRATMPASFASGGLNIGLGSAQAP